MQQHRRPRAIAIAKSENAHLVRVGLVALAFSMTAAWAYALLTFL